MVMMKGILVVVVLLALYQGAVCLNNGLARTPQMGELFSFPQNEAYGVQDGTLGTSMAVLSQNR